MSELTNSQIDRLIYLEKTIASQQTTLGSQANQIESLTKQNEELRDQVKAGTAEVILVPGAARHNGVICNGCGTVWDNTKRHYCPNCGSSRYDRMETINKGSIIYKNIDDATLQKIIQTEEYKALSSEKDILEAKVKELNKQVADHNDAMEEKNEETKKQIARAEKRSNAILEGHIEKYNEDRAEWSKKEDELNLTIQELKEGIVDELTSQSQQDELNNLRTTVEQLNNKLSDVLNMPFAKLLIYRNKLKEARSQGWDEIAERISEARSVLNCNYWANMMGTWRLSMDNVPFLKRRRRAAVQHAPKKSNK